jgi:hypothetical protein
MVFAIGLGQLVNKMFTQVTDKLTSESLKDIEAYICAVGDLVQITSKAESVDTQVQAKTEITSSLIVPYLEFVCNNADFTARFFPADKSQESGIGGAVRMTIYKLFKESLFTEGMINSMDGHALN